MVTHLQAGEGAVAAVTVRVGIVSGGMVSGGMTVCTHHGTR